MNIEEVVRNSRTKVLCNRHTSKGEERKSQFLFMGKENKIITEGSTGNGSHPHPSEVFRAVRTKNCLGEKKRNRNHFKDVPL